MYICSTITIFLYEAKERATEDDMTSDVIDIFQASRQNYGTRKIKVELKKRGLIVSRRRIGRIMQEQGLVSTYTVAQFKRCNLRDFMILVIIHCETSK